MPARARRGDGADLASPVALRLPGTARHASALALPFALTYNSSEEERASRNFTVTRSVSHPPKSTAFERLYRRRLPPTSILTHELAREMADLSHALNRRVGLLVDRAGRVERVAVGDARKVAVPRQPSAPAGRDRFCTLRFLATRLSDEPLTAGELAPLALHRLDAMAVVAVEPDGMPGPVRVAHLLPADEGRSERAKEPSEESAHRLPPGAITGASAPQAKARQAGRGRRDRGRGALPRLRAAAGEPGGRRLPGAHRRPGRGIRPAARAHPRGGEGGARHPGARDHGPARAGRSLAGRAPGARGLRGPARGGPHPAATGGLRLPHADGAGAPRGPHRAGHAPAGRLHRGRPEPDAGPGPRHR